MDALRLYQLRNFINILFQSLQEKNHYTLQGPLSFSSSRSFIFHRYQGKFLFYLLKQWNNWNKKVEYFQMVIEVQFSNNFDSTSFFSSRLFDAIEIFFIEYVEVIPECLPINFFQHDRFFFSLFNVF